MRRFTSLCLAALADALLLAVPAAQAANNIVTIHTPPGKWINKGSLTALDLVNGSLDTRVVVPDSYNKSKCMPVLYLLHGTGSEIHPGSTEWFNGGHIDQQANLPAITVVPGGGPSWWIDQWSNTARRPAWESWLWNTVMPAVNKKFNICPQRSQHTVAGLSMGGYGALYLASQRPGYFGSAASFSGVISLHRPEWTPYDRFKQLWGPAYGFYALAHDPTTLVPNLKNTRILVDAGNGDTIGNEALDPSKRLEELEFTRCRRTSSRTPRRPASTSPTRSTRASTRGRTGWSASTTSSPGTPSRRSSRPRRGGRCTPPASRATPGATSGSWRPTRARRSSSPTPRTFKAEGLGRMTIVTPQGRTVKGTLPFTLKGKKVKRIAARQGPAADDRQAGPGHGQRDARDAHGDVADHGLVHDDVAAGREQGV